MSVKERIAAIRLAKKVEKHREYAEGIGVYVRMGKGECGKYLRKENPDGGEKNS